MSRKVVIGCLLSSFIMISANASASEDNNHTVSLGYAQSKVQDFKNIRGVNAQYRYEWDSQVSFISSFTSMKGDDSYSLRENSSGYDSKINMKYYSLLAGPAYRIHDDISLYVLVGLAHTKIEEKTTYLTQYSEQYKGNATSIAYGAGIAINPIENISVNIGYEGTHTKYNENISINGLNLGVGYRF